MLINVDVALISPQPDSSNRNESYKNDLWYNLIEMICCNHAEDHEQSGRG